MHLEIENAFLQSLGQNAARAARIVLGTAFGSVAKCCEVSGSVGKRVCSLGSDRQLRVSGHALYHFDGGRRVLETDVCEYLCDYCINAQNGREEAGHAYLKG